MSAKGLDFDSDPDSNLNDKSNNSKNLTHITDQEKDQEKEKEKENEKENENEREKEKKNEKDNENEKDDIPMIYSHPSLNLFVCAICHPFDKKEIKMVKGGMKGVFAYLSAAKRHVRIHCEPQYECSNDGCELKFCDASAKRRHQRSVHDKFNYEDCTQCGKSFRSKWDLKRHSRMHHFLSTKNFRCEQCGKGFLEKSKLKRHSFIHKKNNYTFDQKKEKEKEANELIEILKDRAVEKQNVKKNNESSDETDVGFTHVSFFKL